MRSYERKTANVSFAYQNEDPIRLNTFFLTVPTGSNAWMDLAPANRFRFMIEPKLQLPNDANMTKLVPPVAVCGSCRADASTGPCFFAAEDVPGKMATYTMRRYWNIDAGATALTGSVNIRFFYDSTERKQWMMQPPILPLPMLARLKPAPGKGRRYDFMGDATHVTPDGVLNALPLTNVNASTCVSTGYCMCSLTGSPVLAVEPMPSV